MTEGPDSGFHVLSVFDLNTIQTPEP